jgi:uncharacterized protein YabE (DUF348 family)
MDLRLRSEFAPALIALVGLALVYAASGRQVELILNGELMVVRTHARTVENVLHDAGIEISPHDRLTPAGGVLLDWESESAPYIRIDSAREISLTIGTGQQVAFSPESSPSNLLAGEGLLLFPGDRLTVDGIPQAHTTVASAIELNRAAAFQVEERGQTSDFFSAAPTVGEALTESGLVIYEGDRLSIDPGSPLVSGLRIELKRGHPISIEGSGIVIHTRSAAETIGIALAEAGVDLVGLDYVLPSSDQPLPADGQIQVVRVQEQVVLEQEPLPFITLYQPLPELEIDKRQVIEAGAYGVSTNRIRIRFEDDQEVGRFVEGDRVAQEATAQIIGYGTDIQVRTISTADGTLEYWRAVEMYTTSYAPSNAGIPEDHPWYGITASGKPLKKGLVAIDRSLIPFGTMMYVPGYGFAEAADTGGGVKGRWIDLGYEDHNYVPWSGYRTVYFLTPVPTPGSIVYIFP